MRVGIRILTAAAVASTALCAFQISQAQVGFSWGSNNVGQGSVPNGSYVQMAAGLVHGIGIKSNGALVGWGANTLGQINVPSGVYKTVAAGAYHNLALRPDGTMVGWGYNLNGQSTPASGTFSAVSCGVAHSVALRTDGTIRAWGFNNFGQAMSPPGRFTAVSAGYYHNVAIRTDGTLYAWGSNLFGEANVPAGQFVAVAAGSNFSTAIRADGVIVTWGNTGFGLRDVPQGNFGSLEAGQDFVIALGRDKQLSAWGRNDLGQCNVPAGTVTSASAGGMFGLGVRMATGAGPGSGLEGYYVGKGLLLSSQIDDSTQDMNLNVESVSMGEGEEEGIVEIFKFDPGMSAPSSLSLTLRNRLNQLGLVVHVQAFDYQEGGYVELGSRVGSLVNQAMKFRAFDAARFVNPLDGKVLVRVSVTQDGEPLDGPGFSLTIDELEASFAE